VFITGGDSGIGRAIALLFAQEGAKLAIVYLNEENDAADTLDAIKAKGSEVISFAGDVSEQAFCRNAIQKTYQHYGRLDVVINNAAVQYPQENPEAITAKQLQQTFSVNVFAAFYCTLAALSYLKKGACIINSTSVTAYRGSHHLIDYAATKGALVAFTRSLSANLAEKGIRVNAVAPGP